jgi:hypothetical protein
MKITSIEVILVDRPAVNPPFVWRKNIPGSDGASVGGWLNNGNTIYLGGEQTSNNGIATMAQADIANNSRINVQVIYTLG